MLQANITPEGSATFIISLTIVVAQILTFLQNKQQAKDIMIKTSESTEVSKSNGQKLNSIHGLVNGNYHDVLIAISELSTRLAEITKDPKDVSNAKKAQSKLEGMKLFLISILLLVVTNGCTTFHSQQIERATDGTTRTTDINAATLFDAHSDLSKLRASTTDKSQTTSIGALDQTATSTNLVPFLDAIIGAAVQAGAKAAKP